MHARLTLTLARMVVVIKLGVTLNPFNYQILVKSACAMQLYICTINSIHNTMLSSMSERRLVACKVQMLSKDSDDAERSLPRNAILQQCDVSYCT